MKTSSIIAVVVAVLVIAGAVWWIASQPTTPSSTDTNTATTTQTSDASSTMMTVLETSSNQTLGTFLVASNGVTLYTYSADTSGVSNCTGTCAVNWPPYLVDPTLTLVGSAAVVSGNIGVLTRANGSVQLTYKGAPLYTYIKDTQAGDTNGQGVGGTWSVDKP